MGGNVFACLVCRLIQKKTDQPLILHVLNAAILKSYQLAFNKTIIMPFLLIQRGPR